MSAALKPIGSGEKGGGEDFLRTLWQGKKSDRVREHEGS